MSPKAEPSQTVTMEILAVNYFLQTSSIVDIRLGFKYASGTTT